MTETSLRNALSYCVLAAHVVIYVLVFVFWSLGGFTFSELTTTLAILSPAIAVLVTPVTTFIIASRHETTPVLRAVTPSFVVMSFMFLIFFVLALVVIVVLKAYSHVFRDFEEFKVALALCESGFGVYCGRVVTTLFGERKRKRV